MTQTSELRVAAVPGSGPADTYEISVSDGATLVVSPSRRASMDAQVEDLFIGGLVASAALALRNYLRTHGFDPTAHSVRARVGSTADGRRCVTVRVSVPSGFSEHDREALRHDLFEAGCRYAPAGNVALDVEFQRPRALLASHTVSRNGGKS